jgi:hypothetical protein
MHMAAMLFFVLVVWDDEFGSHIYAPGMLLN